MADSFAGGCEWLAAARAGSKEALGQLLEACRGYLLLIAQQELDPDLRAKGGASDLVQQTFLEAQRDFDRFQGTSEAELLAWLRQILRNNIANFSRSYHATAKRSLACEVALDVVAAADGAPPPGDELIVREETEQIRRALDRLPPEYRQVLLWRYEEELPFEDIGRSLQRSANAARKLWARALERLGQELDAEPRS